MKSFLKMLLATIVGIILILFIGFIVVAALVSSASKKEEIKQHSVLTLDVNTVIYERAQDNPFAAFDPLSGQPEKPLGLNQFRAVLKAAAKDDNIEGLLLNGGIPVAGAATLREMRTAIRHFSDSGKFVYAYAEVMSQKGYYLASAADSVFLLPEGSLEWRGLNASVVYLHNALDKLGVDPVVLRAEGNKFKSAVEPFLRTDMSPENRAQLTEILGDSWRHYRQDVAQSRSLSIEALDQWADSLAIITPLQAVNLGLVDKLAYQDQINDRLVKKSGAKDLDNLAQLSIGRYAKLADIKQGSFKDDRIAVIIAQGDIVMGDEGEYRIGSERIASAIRKARKDDRVKAIVLRVNSPGGSALASEVIWREMDLARQAKPVIASLSDVAASGGYYISCLADTIIAQPNTITGSIGAFGLFFTAEELLNDKLGINIETVTTNRYSDLGTPDRGLSEAERQLLINQVNEIYRTFTERVAEGRQMTPAQVDSLGGGRVYSGERALELGLVDMLGGWDDAIETARLAAGIGEEYRLVEYPEKEDPLKQALRMLGADVEQRILVHKLGPYARYAEMLEGAQQMEGLQTRLEYDLSIE